MTESEAISFLKERQEVSKDYPEVAEYYGALSVAIQALEEVQQYRKIGTVRNCKLSVEICKAMIERGIEPENVEAYLAFEDRVIKNGFTIKGLLEAAKKQKPFKPQKARLLIGIGRCKCGAEFINADTNYCGNCGQKLDWSDEG